MNESNEFDGFFWFMLLVGIVGVPGILVRSGGRGVMELIILLVLGLILYVFIESIVRGGS